jgi:CarD family transcriptional regulator
VDVAFKVGQTVIYPHHGAAVVERREQDRAFGDDREFLVLRTVDGDLTVHVPVDNAERVGVRALVCEGDVDEVFEVLRRRDVQLPASWPRRLKNHTAKLHSGNVYELAEVVRNLSVQARSKPLAAAESVMLKKARRILVSELGAALGVADEQVQERIDQALT